MVGERDATFSRSAGVRVGWWLCRRSFRLRSKIVRSSCSWVACVTRKRAWRGFLGKNFPRYSLGPPRSNRTMLEFYSAEWGQQTRVETHRRKTRIVLLQLPYFCSPRSLLLSLHTNKHMHRLVMRSLTRLFCFCFLFLFFSHFFSPFFLIFSPRLSWEWCVVCPRSHVDARVVCEGVGYT